MAEDNVLLCTTVHKTEIHKINVPSDLDLEPRPMTFKLFRGQDKFDDDRAEAILISTTVYKTEVHN